MPMDPEPSESKARKKRFSSFCAKRSGGGRRDKRVLGHKDGKLGERYGDFGVGDWVGSKHVT